MPVSSLLLNNIELPVRNALLSFRMGRVLLFQDSPVYLHGHL